MTAAEFKAAKKALGCSWAQLAAVLGYSHEQNLLHFANGRREVPHLVGLMLTILLRVPAARSIAGLSYSRASLALSHGSTSGSPK
jgi:hypothetical protein